MKTAGGIRPRFLLGTILGFAVLAGIAWLVFGKGYREGFADKTWPEAFVLGPENLFLEATIDEARFSCRMTRVEHPFYRDMASWRLPALRTRMTGELLPAQPAVIAEETVRWQEVNILLSQIRLDSGATPIHGHTMVFGYGGEGHIVACLGGAADGATSRKVIGLWVERISLWPR